MINSHGESPSSNESNKENQKPQIVGSNNTFNNNDNEIPLSFSPPPPRNKIDRYNNSNVVSAPPLSRAEDLSKVFEGDEVFLRRSPPTTTTNNNAVSENDKENRQNRYNRYGEQRDYDRRYQDPDSPIRNRDYGYSESYRAYKNMPPPASTMSLSAELEQETTTEADFYSFDRKQRSSPRETSSPRGNRYGGNRSSPQNYYNQQYSYPPNSPYGHEQQRRDNYPQDPYATNPSSYAYPPSQSSSHSRQSSSHNYYNYPPPAPSNSIWPDTNEFIQDKLPENKEKSTSTPRKRSHESDTTNSSKRISPSSPKPLSNEESQNKSRSKGMTSAAETLLQVSSPYHSPAPKSAPTYSSSSSKKPKRSPLDFNDGVATPNNKDYFSAFSMEVDTPNKDNHHMPFSPMGPAFPNSFDALPLPNSNSLSSDDTPIPVDNQNGRMYHPDSIEKNTTPFLRRRSPPPSTSSSALPAQSPFSAIMGGCFDVQSPFPNSEKISMSPYPQYKEDYDPHRGMSTPPSANFSSRGGRHEEAHPSNEPSIYGRETPLFKASPVSTHPSARSNAPPSAASGLHSARDRFRKMQNGPPPSSSPFRLQIGNSGMKNDNRKVMPENNSRLRHGNGRDALAPTHRHNTFPSPPLPTHQRYPMGYVEYDDHSHHPPTTFTGSSRGGHYKYGTPFNASDSTPGMAPSSASSGYYSSGGQNHYGGYYAHPYMKPHHQVLTPNRHINKENDPPSSSTSKKSSRRAPCNCKRSKCLKLYCECFAAEQYCDGCNCQDCCNIPAFESLRMEAIKTTRAKNPNAFKPRFTSKSSRAAAPTFSSTPTKNVGGHNMGCRCKKSACLKKYCECFEAGAMCGDKCKCVDCLNFIGSQALIDRRRKIKDHRGAELAMKSADEAWKSGRLGDPYNRRRSTPSSTSSVPSSGGHYSVPRSSTSARSSYNRNYPPPQSFPPPSTRKTMPPPSQPSLNTPSTTTFSIQNPQPGYNKPPPATPKQTPKAIRLDFNTQSSKLNRKIKPGETEPTFPVFGLDNPEQTKTSTLAIFSFLSNDDLYNASLVNKKWTSLSLDEELWQFS